MSIFKILLQKNINIYTIIKYYKKLNKSKHNISTQQSM